MTGVADLVDGDKVFFITSKSYSLAMLTVGTITKTSPTDGIVVLDLPLSSQPSWQVFQELHDGFVAVASV